jgi:hypothetical protein
MSVPWSRAFVAAVARRLFRICFERGAEGRGPWSAAPSYRFIQSNVANVTRQFTGRGPLR